MTPTYACGHDCFAVVVRCEVITLWTLDRLPDESIWSRRVSHAVLDESTYSFHHFVTRRLCLFPARKERGFDYFRLFSANTENLGMILSFSGRPLILQDAVLRAFPDMAPSAV